MWRRRRSAGPWPRRPTGSGGSSALRQAGLAPQVIEREPGRGVAGTGIYLPANGVRALRTLLWLRTRLTPWTTLQGHPTQTFM